MVIKLYLEEKAQKIWKQSKTFAIRRQTSLMITNICCAVGQLVHKWLPSSQSRFSGFKICAKKVGKTSCANQVVQPDYQKANLKLLNPLHFHHMHPRKLWKFCVQSIHWLRWILNNAKLFLNKKELIKIFTILPCPRICEKSSLDRVNTIQPEQTYTCFAVWFRPLLRVWCYVFLQCLRMIALFTI